MIVIRYFGGKYKKRKHYSEIINVVSKDKHFVSLFCGACGIEGEIKAKSKHINDLSEYTYALWKGLEQGRTLPNKCSEEDFNLAKCRYKLNKNNTTDYDKFELAYIGFQCSFGGRLFTGYSRTNMDYAKAGIKSTMNTWKGLSEVPLTITNLDYRDVEIPDGSVVLCDPPYDIWYNGYETEKFDINAFWEYVRKLSKRCYVFVTEYKAPDDFISIWEDKVKITTSQRVKTENLEKVEKMFIYNNGLFQGHNN